MLGPILDARRAAGAGAEAFLLADGDGDRIGQSINLRVQGFPQLLQQWRAVARRACAGEPVRVLHRC